MNPSRSSIHRRWLPVLGSALLLGPAPLPAQQPAAPAEPPAASTAATTDSFDYTIGNRAVEGAVSTVHTVQSTQPYNSPNKSAKIRFTVRESDAKGTMTHLLTVNTGKYKTVSQMSATLADIFRKFLSAAPTGQEIGKIGDVRYGGEIRFFAESRDVLRYEWVVPGQAPQAIRFGRNDIQTFLDLLTQTPPAVAR